MRSHHNFTLEEFTLWDTILSSYAWYQHSIKIPIPQVDFMMHQITAHCNENRLNWSKAKWRKFICKSFTTLHACELIEELHLNEL